MPWIVPTPGGWIVRHRVGGRGGKQVNSEVFPRKDQAQARLKAWRRELAAKAPVRRGRALTLDQLLEQWKCSRLARDNDPAHTAKAVSRIQGMIAAQGWQHLADITTAAVEAWRQAGGSPRAGAVLRGILRFAIEVHEQPVDPRVLIALRPRRAPKRPRPPLMANERYAEVLALADAAGANAGTLVRCLDTYGWRPITAARLVVGKLHLASGEVEIGVKQGDQLRHPLRAEHVAALAKIAARRPAGDKVFTDPRSAREWTIDGVGSISQWCRDYLGCKAYDFKRRAISRMLRRGLAVQEIQRFTGHRTASQVLRYAVTNEEELQRALGLMSTNEHEPTRGAHFDDCDDAESPVKYAM